MLVSLATITQDGTQMAENQDVVLTLVTGVGPMNSELADFDGIPSFESFEVDICAHRISVLPSPIAEDITLGAVNLQLSQCDVSIFGKVFGKLFRSFIGRSFQHFKEAREPCLESGRRSVGRPRCVLESHVCDRMSMLDLSMIKK